jgi:hypothetical protein
MMMAMRKPRVEYGVKEDVNQRVDTQHMRANLSDHGPKFKKVASRRSGNDVDGDAKARKPHDWMCDVWPVAVMRILLVAINESYKRWEAKIIERSQDTKPRGRP